MKNKNKKRKNTKSPKKTLEFDSVWGRCSKLNKGLTPNSWAAIYCATSAYFYQLEYEARNKLKDREKASRSVLTELIGHVVEIEGVIYKVKKRPNYYSIMLALPIVTEDYGLKNFKDDNAFLNYTNVIKSQSSSSTFIPLSFDNHIWFRLDNLISEGNYDPIPLLPGARLRILTEIGTYRKGKGRGLAVGVKRWDILSSYVLTSQKKTNKEFVVRNGEKENSYFTTNTDEVKIFPLSKITRTSETFGVLYNNELIPAVNRNVYMTELEKLSSRNEAIGEDGEFNSEALELVEKWFGGFLSIYDKKFSASLQRIKLLNIQDSKIPLYLEEKKEMINNEKAKLLINKELKNKRKHEIFKHYTI